MTRTKPESDGQYACQIWCPGTDWKKHSKAVKRNPVWIWFENNKQLMKDNNPLDPSTHMIIAQMYGVTTQYTTELNALGNDVPPMLKYYILVWVIQSRKKSQDKYISVGQPEGNNRMSAAIHLLLNSKYDSASGKICYGTLTKEWIAKKISQHAEKQQECLKLLNAQDELMDMLTRTVKDPSTMFGRQMRCLLLTGTTKEEFDKLGITAKQAQVVLREVISKGISISKTNSSVPDEATLIAEAITEYKNALEKNFAKECPGEYPSYAVWDEIETTYIDFKIEKSERSEDGVACHLFESDEWMDFTFDPTPENLQAFANICQAGVVKREGGKLECIHNKTLTPPFVLSDETFFHCNGTPNTSTRYEKLNPKTQRVTPGKKRNKPLPLEDINRWMVLAMVFPPLFRCKHGISPNAWADHKDRKQCQKELRLLVESQACSTVSKSNVPPPKDLLARFDIPPGDGPKYMPIATGNEHWAAAMLIADLVVSSSYMRPKRLGSAKTWNTSMVTTNLEKVIDTIHNLPKDGKSYYNYDMMDDLGKDTI